MDDLAENQTHWADGAGGPSKKPAVTGTGPLPDFPFEKRHPTNVSAGTTSSLRPDQVSILEHLLGGPQHWCAISRRLHVLCSDTRPSECQRQLGELITQGLVEELKDGQYRLIAQTNCRG